MSKDLKDLAAQIDAVFDDLDLQPGLLDESPAAEPVATKLDSGAEWRLRIEQKVASEVEHLVTEKLQELLAADPSDLRPQLYREDPVAEAEWQMKGDTTLYELQIRDLQELQEFLRGGPMSLERCEASVRALTDLRFGGVNLGEQDSARYRVLTWLTALLLELL
jgi:hypothetical protein